MRLWSPGLLLSAVALVGACGGSNDYPDSFDSSFIRSCTATGGGRSYCECALDAVHDNYKYEEVIGLLFDDLSGIIESCS